jgi:hypothetical protein
MKKVNYYYTYLASRGYNIDCIGYSRFQHNINHSVKFKNVYLINHEFNFSDANLNSYFYKFLKIYKSIYIKMFIKK